MSNVYFDSADFTGPSKNTLARASTIDGITDALEAGFDKLPTEDNIKKGMINYAVDSGAADAYVVSLPHAPAAYGDGLEVNVKIANTNTGASVINVNSLGNVAIKRHDGNDTEANDLIAGSVVPLRHNGTIFRIVGPTSSDAIAAAASATAAAASATAAATAETNAETAETNAETAETNAETAQTAAETAETNAVNAAGFKFTFDTGTSMADPGAGDIRFNNATVANVTALALDATSADTGNPDVSDFIAAWDDSTNTALRGTIIIRKIGAPATFAIFNVTGAVTDNTGWLQVTVTHVASNGTFSAADSLIVHFTRTGDMPNAYDVAFNAGFGSDMTGADLIVQTYGELVMTRSGSFTGEAGYIDTVATGAAAIVDIEKNGTTIYATKPQFAISSNTMTAGTLKTDGTEDFVSGDRITFKVTQIGSTIDGQKLRFTVKGTAA